MSVTTERQRRRDRRFRFRDGSATILIPAHRPDEHPIEAAVIDLSVAGISFELEPNVPGPEVDTVFGSVTIRVGMCVLEGGIRIKNVVLAGGRRIRVGALFYPDSGVYENRLMALISGLSVGG